MRLSVTKNLISVKSSKTYPIRDYDTPVDSIHDIAQRPVDCIQESSMVDEDERDSTTKNLPYGSCDHYESDDHANSGTLICDGEEKAPPNNKQEIVLFSSEDVDERQKKEAVCQEIGEYIKKDDINLSFCLEESLLDSRFLDEVLCEARNGEGMGTRRISHDSLNRKPENDFEGAFVNLGQVIYRNQPDRISSDVKYVGYSESEVRRKLFGSNNLPGQVASYATTTIYVFASVLVTYLFHSGFTQKDIETSDEIDGQIQEDYTNEVFLQAMYLISTLDLQLCNTTLVSNVSISSPMRPCLQFMIAAVVIILIIKCIDYCMIKVVRGRCATQIVDPYSDKELTKLGTKSVKCLPSGKSRLHVNTLNCKREMSSLQKTQIITTSFITETVSPTGELSTVKRSARIECMKVKKEVENALKVNLTGLFDLEGKSPLVIRNTTY